MEKRIHEYRIKQQNGYKNAQFNCNQEHDYHHCLKSNKASKYTQTEINHFHTNVENTTKYIAPVHVRKNCLNRSNKPKSVTQQERGNQSELIYQPHIKPREKIETIAPDYMKDYREKQSKKTNSVIQLERATQTIPVFANGGGEKNQNEVF